MIELTFAVSNISILRSLLLSFLVLWFALRGGCQILLSGALLLLSFPWSLFPVHFSLCDHRRTIFLRLFLFFWPLIHSLSQIVVWFGVRSGAPSGGESILPLGYLAVAAANHCGVVLSSY